MLPICAIHIDLLSAAVIASPGPADGHQAQLSLGFFFVVVVCFFFCALSDLLWSLVRFHRSEDEPGARSARARVCNRVTPVV